MSDRRGVFAGAAGGGGGMKRCGRCGEDKLESQFSRNKRTGDGLQVWCRVCMKDYKKSRRHLYRDYDRQYERDHPEVRARANKNYREKDIEGSRLYRREHRRLNPQMYREYGRRHRQKNPERDALNGVRRRARKVALPRTLTNAQWGEIKAFWAGCAYCGRTDAKVHCDHVIPLVRQECPGTVLENVLPACPSCNTSKRERELGEWLIWRFGEEQAGMILERIQDYFANLKS